MVKFICPHCSKIDLVCSEIICDEAGNNIEVYYAYCQKCDYRSRSFDNYKDLEEDIAEDRLERIDECKEGYCPAREDETHCEHWWDGFECCDCKYNGGEIE